VFETTIVVDLDAVLGDKRFFRLSKFFDNFFFFCTFLMLLSVGIIDEGNELPALIVLESHIELSTSMLIDPSPVQLLFCADKRDISIIF